jgi:hypothetical protein
MIQLLSSQIVSLVNHLAFEHLDNLGAPAITRLADQFPLGERRVARSFTILDVHADPILINAFDA